MWRIETGRYLLVAFILTYYVKTEVDGLLKAFLTPELRNTEDVCGGEYNAPNGSIISPKYEQNNGNTIRCEWKIAVPEGYIVMLRILETDIRQNIHCSNYVFNVRDVSGTGDFIAAGSCKTKKAKTIPATGNSMWVLFISDGPIENGSRFQAEWTSVRMSCNPGWRLSKFSNDAVESCIKPALFGVGDDRSYDAATKICAEYRARLATITSAQQDTRLLDSIGSNIQYFIGLRRNGSDNWRWITDEPYNYTRLKRAIPAHDCVAIQLVHVLGTAFKNWGSTACTGSGGYVCEHDISEGDQCGNIYTTHSGTLSSPNFPSIYNIMEHCEWRITTSRGSVILLVFTHLDIPSSRNCKSDYVKIGEGMGSNKLLLRLFCGTENPLPVGTAVNTAFIEFRSSDLSPRTGFQLRWATNSCTYNCDEKQQAVDFYMVKDACELTCRSRDTQYNIEFACQPSCDRSQCEGETESDSSCCTASQCTFTIALLDTVTETSELMTTEQDTPEVLTMRESPYHTPGTNVVLSATIPTLAVVGIACGILVWKLRQRRIGGKQSPPSCCCVTTWSSRRKQTRQNDCVALSPILQTILEQEVKLKLQPLLMKEDSVQLQDQLGRGAFGIVFKGTYRPGSHPPRVLTVAIKTLLDKCIGSDISAFVDEAITMAEFSHIHVLSVIGVCINQKTEVPMIVLPFMEHGDLKTYLRESRQNKSAVEPPDEMQLLLFCLHIARGMTYLADLKFIHRDLAARNCMLDGNMVVKVADFGLSRDVYSQSYYRQEHQKMLPIKWMALESLHDQWSYGVTVWEVMSLGKVPYTELDNSGVLAYLETGARLPHPNTCPAFLYTLMTSCWEETPEDRPTFHQISKQISDYLTEKCDYLDLNLEGDTNLNTEISDTSHVAVTCSIEVMSEYADNREPQLCND